MGEVVKNQSRSEIVTVRGHAVELFGLRRAITFDALAMHGASDADRIHDYELRKKIVVGDRPMQVSQEEAIEAAEDLLDYTPRDMPARWGRDDPRPDPEAFGELREDLLLLLDAAGFRHGAIGRGDAWAIVGLSPKEGRDLVGRDLLKLRWPTFYAIRSMALAAHPLGLPQT